MEIRIALSTLAPVPRPGKLFGLALDVTDTKTSWSFWPAGAALQRPASWGKAMLVHCVVNPASHPPAPGGVAPPRHKLDYACVGAPGRERG